MLRRIQTFFDFLVYFISAGTAHSVHSPFIYDFVTRVLNARRQKPAYHGIELVRTRMLTSRSLVEVQPLGAAGGTETKKVMLKTLTARTSKSAKYGELLERICEYYQPRYAIEIGTSLGISTMYQALGLTQGYLLTLEGNEASLKIAKHNAEKLGFQNIQFVEGLFEKTLPMVVQAIPHIDYVFFDGNHTMQATLDYFEQCLTKSHENTIFVFDDIRWSDEMFKAWQKIKNHDKVRVTVDLFFMGIVFFRPGQEKEHFTIRF